MIIEIWILMQTSLAVKVHPITGPEGPRGGIEI
jgi:hypothetical protein